MTLRNYQSELLQALRNKLAGGLRRIIAYLPTGGGKTNVAMEMIVRHLGKGGRALFVMHLIELINQTSIRFDAAGIDHGIIQADHWRTNGDKLVQICSIQSLNARRYLPESTLIVIDEAHHAVAPTYRKFIARNSALPIIGLTATPFAKGMARHDENIGGPIWQDIASVVTIRSLIDQGFLVDCDVYAPCDPDLTGVVVTGGDYNEAQLAERMDTAPLVGDIPLH